MPGDAGERVVGMLLGVMPLTRQDEKRIRRAQERLATARAEYEAAILEASANGARLREIAAVAGVSYQTIHTLIRKYRNV